MFTAYAIPPTDEGLAVVLAVVPQQVQVDVRESWRAAGTVLRERERERERVLY